MGGKPVQGDQNRSDVLLSASQKATKGALIKTNVFFFFPCPSAGVWRSGHTRGPAAPKPQQTPNQQNNSSSHPLPRRAATRQQGCGKTPPLAPLALQYFVIVSN